MALWLYDGATWTVAQNWTTTNTNTWTPTVNGAYVGVWARSAGSTVDAPDAALSVQFTIAGAGSGQ